MDYPPYLDTWKSYDLDAYGSGCYFPYTDSYPLYPSYHPRTHYDDTSLYQYPRYPYRHVNNHRREDLPKRRNCHDCSSSHCQRMKIENSCNCSWKPRRYHQECCNHQKPKCCYPQCYNSLLEKFLLSPYIK